MRFSIAATLVIASAGLTVSQPLAAQDAAAADLPASTNMLLADKIMVIAYPAEAREAMFMAASEQMEGQMLQSLSNTMDNISPETVEIIRSWQEGLTVQQRVILRDNIPNLMTSWARAYATIFTEQELRDILAFVKTDTGTTFLMKSTEVMSDPTFAAANQVYLDQTMKLLTDSVPALMGELIASKDSEPHAN